MAGFPLRPARPAYGVTKVNAVQIRDPKRQSDALVFNTLFDMVAGGAAATPFAVFVFDPALNGGAGGFEYFSMLNPVDYGVEFTKVSDIYWTFDFQHGGYTDENGAVTTFAEAVADPTLSPYLHHISGAEVMLLEAGLPNGAYIQADTPAAGDPASIDVQMFNTAAVGYKFSMVVWGRNGSYKLGA